MKISIVTISFNQARYLPEAIESVRSSEGHTVEYVMVDPGSSDGSREIIERNRRRFSHVVLDRDKGPSDGLNKGFDLCEGEVLGYLNADDRYPPGTLDFVAAYFEAHPETDVLFGAIAIMNGMGRWNVRGRVPDVLELRKYAEEACHVWCPATFFRHNAFLRSGGFNIANRTCWDGELAVDLALSGARLGYSNRVLGEFRIYAESLTGSRRHWSRYKADRRRIRDRIYASGAAPYSPMEARALRLWYKFNPARHFSYVNLRAPLRPEPEPCMAGLAGVQRS